MLWPTLLTAVSSNCPKRPTRKDNCKVYTKRSENSRRTPRTQSGKFAAFRIVSRVDKALTTWFKSDLRPQVTFIERSCALRSQQMTTWMTSVPTCSPSRGRDVAVYVFVCVWHKPTELAHSFLFSSCICFCLYGPFNCISFHKLSRQLSAFSLCSFGLISDLLVLLTIYLFTKVSLSPDIILCGWLGLKHQLTN